MSSLYPQLGSVLIAQTSVLTSILAEQEEPSHETASPWTAPFLATGSLSTRPSQLLGLCSSWLPSSAASHSPCSRLWSDSSAQAQTSDADTLASSRASLAPAP